MSDTSTENYLWGKNKETAVLLKSADMMRQSLKTKEDEMTNRGTGSVGKEVQTYSTGRLWQTERLDGRVLPQAA